MRRTKQKKGMKFLEGRVVNRTRDSPWRVEGSWRGEGEKFSASFSRSDMDNAVTHYDLRGKEVEILLRGRTVLGARYRGDVILDRTDRLAFNERVPARRALYATSSENFEFPDIPF